MRQFRSQKENSAKWHFQRNLQHFALAPFIGSCPGNLPLPSGIKTRMRNRKRLQPTILAEIRIPIAYLSFSGFLPQEKDSFRKKALLKKLAYPLHVLEKSNFQRYIMGFYNTKALSYHENLHAARYFFSCGPAVFCRDHCICRILCRASTLQKSSEQLCLSARRRLSDAIRRR